MSRCQNHWRGQHKFEPRSSVFFEPRYDEALPEGMESVKAASISAIKAIKTITYVRDVCVRCGDTIEREKRE